MALVSRIPALHQQFGSMRFREVRAPRRMPFREEDIVEESAPPVIEGKIYVAVGKEFEKNKSIISWAVQNSRGKRICIIHVHQPAQWIPVPEMGTKLPASRVSERQVKAYRETERKSMLTKLDQYLLLCFKAGVQAEKDFIEIDSIEKGILALISRHGIRELVMGAASNKYNLKKMKDLKSKKAILLRDQAPTSCKIWFVCRGGELIHLREASVDRSDIESPSLLLRSTSNAEAGESHDESDSSTRTLLACSSSPSRGADAVERGLQSTSPGQLIDDLNHSLTPRVLEVTINEGLDDQVKQVMGEAENSRREACQEAIKRAKAEKDAIEAIHRAKSSEVLYSEELKRRKGVEEALAKEKEELDAMKNQRDQVMKALQVNLNEVSLLENQMEESDRMVKELENKIFSAVDLLQKYRDERVKLQMERDLALKEAEDLRESQAEASTVHIPQFVTEFSFADTMAATNGFDPSLKIGEGGYGSIYKGLIRHTEVAVKVLNSDSAQGPSEFQQEVDILSKIRHPNLVTLVGTCPEAWTLIYEYLPNGSLEDRLSCVDNSPPLPWQTRICIATELCSVLIFLHSCKPQGIVHGDLKPANILLDANFVCKLGDFGLCRLLCDELLVCKTSPKGTFGYMDPEFFATGELTPQSDIYSFGIILLQLLTGRSPRGIANEVQYAVDTKRLNNLLDPLSGDWPFVQAEQLANLALRCCQVDRKNRPDLETEVWKVLESMKLAACGGSSCSEAQFQPPKYFICPIFQEIMQDPHVAADGYSYEAEALKGWLDSGNETSPMTNHRLSHREIVPNYALRSIIQEWKEQRYTECWKPR